MVVFEEFVFWEGRRRRGVGESRVLSSHSGVGLIFLEPKASENQEYYYSIQARGVWG